MKLLYVLKQPKEIKNSSKLAESQREKKQTSETGIYVIFQQLSKSKALTR